MGAEFGAQPFSSRLDFNSLVPSHMKPHALVHQPVFQVIKVKLLKVSEPASTGVLPLSSHGANMRLHCTLSMHSGKKDCRVPQSRGLARALPVRSTRSLIHPHFNVPASAPHLVFHTCHPHVAIPSFGVCTIRGTDYIKESRG